MPESPFTKYKYPCGKSGTSEPSLSREGIARPLDDPKIQFDIDMTVDFPSTDYHVPDFPGFQINIPDDVIMIRDNHVPTGPPDPPTILVDITPCDDGVIDLSFVCPWGCTKGRGRAKRPRRHLHGGGFVGGPISLGDRVSHCHQPGAPSSYVLVPAKIPEGYAADPDDPCYLVPKLE